MFQADVCHAYQILKKGGIKDENIVVFMYDDIAFNKENPRPGVIINSPHGDDVYQGVPKVCLFSSLCTSLKLWMQIPFSSNNLFSWGRIIQGKMLPLATFLPLSLGIKLLLKEVVGRLLTVVRMITFSYTIAIMAVLGCSVSSSLVICFICFLGFPLKLCSCTRKLQQWSVAFHFL